MLSGIGSFVEEWREELFLVLVLLLIACVSFLLGRLSVSPSEGGEFTIASTPVPAEELHAVLTASTTPLAEEGTSSAPTSIVGNKNSKIFHLATCPGARNMSEGNKIYFESAAAAVAAGFRPAGNCPGL
jgi:hypothetical protein